MAYKARIGSKDVEISKKAFIVANNKLSTQYHEELNPEKKRKIIGILFELDKNLFKEWKIYGDENRKDYAQEAYFWIIRALETFKPGKGSFVSWLKWYILKAQTEVGAAGRQAALNGPEIELTAPTEDHPDSIYWRAIKSKCTDTEWSLLSSQLIHRYTLEESAAISGLTIDQARGRYNGVLQRLKLELTKSNHHGSQQNKQANQSETEDGSKWITKKQLCEKLQIKPTYLKDLMNKRRPISQAPYYIDPKDILEIGRIRYLETTAGGLIYPRIIRKKPSRFGSLDDF